LALSRRDFKLPTELKMPCQELGRHNLLGFSMWKPSLVGLNELRRNEFGLEIILKKLDVSIRIRKGKYQHLVADFPAENL